MKYQGTLIINAFTSERPFVLTRMPAEVVDKLYAGLVACFKTGTVVEVFTDKGDQWLLVVRDHRTCYVPGMYKDRLASGMKEKGLDVRSERNIIDGDNEVLFIQQAGPTFSSSTYTGVQNHRTHLSQPWSRTVWFNLPYHESGRSINNEMRQVFSARANNVAGFSGEMRGCTVDFGKVSSTYVFGNFAVGGDKVRYVLIDTRPIVGSAEPILPTPVEFMNWGQRIFTEM